MINKNEVNKQNTKTEKPKIDHESIRRGIVNVFKEPHPTDKHIKTAANKINKRIDSHFNGTSKGRSMKDMPEEKNTLSIIKEVSPQFLVRAAKKALNKSEDIRQSANQKVKNMNTMTGDDNQIVKGKEKEAGELSKEVNADRDMATKKANQARLFARAAARKIQKDDVKLEEAVTVKKSTHSWGKMITVHHGSSHSFPLHPEHQEKIASLKDGESTSFTDETNSKVTAHRDGDTVHLSLRGSNTKTPVPMHHFQEEVNLEEANMPIGIAIKKRIKSQLSDDEFARKHAGKTISQLQRLAKLHGLPINHYVDRRNAGRSTAGKKMKIEGVEHVDEGLGKTLAAGALALGIGAAGGAAISKAYPDKPLHYQVKKIGDKFNVYHKNNIGGKVHFSSDSESKAKEWMKANEELELDEAKRGRPRKDGKTSGDDEGGREHIIVQLRKAENLRGNREIEFNDGKKHQLPLSHVKKALDMHLKMKPIQKGEFEAHIAKSHKHFDDVVAKGKPVEVASKKGVTLAKSVKEDYNTVRAAARGPEIPVTVMNPSTGKLEVIKRRMPRKEIKIEARDQFAKQYLSPEEAEEKKEGQGSPKGASADMTADSRNKLKTDPLFSKVKLSLPPTVGNKAAGGEDTVYGLGKYSVAEEKTLNSLYEDLSEENKEFFNDLMQTEEGIEKLLQFARGQGY